MRSILLALLIFSGGAIASGLTERDAVEQGMRLPAIERQLEARRGMARGQLESAGHWDNPEIEYNRESVEIPGGSVDEDTYMIRQRFNIAGVKGLERRSARSQLSAEEARIELAKREIVANIRDAFYNALAAEERRDSVRHWRSRLEELAAAVAARARAGDASRYESARVERELALLQSRWLRVNGETETALDWLSTLTGSDAGKLAGQLLPSATVPAQVSVAFDNHPRLQAFTADAESAEYLRKAASREKWPEITLGLGHKEVSEPGLEGDGAVVSLGIEVPLFDRGQGPAAINYERSRLLSAERELARQRLEAKARAILRRWQAGMNAVQTIERQQPDELIGMAEAAYKAGEITVAELMDAWSAELDTQLERLDRALAARQALIQWQTLTGE